MSACKEEEQLLARISNLPLVRAVLSQCSNIYQITKAQHDLLSITLEKTEKGFHFASTTVSTVYTTVTRPIHKPLNALDSWACGGLDSLERQFPVIKKTPQQLYNGIQDYGQHKREQVSTYGMEKIDHIKEYGRNKMSSAAEQTSAVLRTPYDLIRKQLLLVMLYADTCVDHYIPETKPSTDCLTVCVPELSPVKDISTCFTATDQMLIIGGKLRCRMYQRAHDSAKTWTSPKHYLHLVGISISDLPTWPQKQDIINSQETPALNH